MKYSKEFDVNEFDFWGGAKDTIKVIKEHKMMGQLQDMLEEIFADKIPTATEINDTVWFDSDEIFNMLGIDESNDAE
jgi:hypothetical protein